MPAPFHIGIDAVAGHAGRILHNGDPAAHHTVEKGGFAYIGAAHNGHQRFIIHRYSFPWHSASTKASPSFSNVRTGTPSAC